MREWIKEKAKDFVALAFFAFGIVGFISSATWIICACIGVGDLHSTWPESAEFSQLMGGQERFSEHATNVDGLTVVVDHETGVQYLADGDGMTALLDADGTPLRVREASDDGE